MHFSRHATVRMQQRGRSEDDIVAIMSYGTRTEDGYLLRNCDADQAIRNLKKQIIRIERLKGWVAITAEDDTVISVYPAQRGKQRKMLRSSQ